MSTDLEQLINDLEDTAAGAPGVASRMDRQGEQAAQRGIQQVESGPGLQQAFAISDAQLSTLTDNTDTDDLLYSLSVNVGESGVTQMLAPMKQGS